MDCRLRVGLLDADVYGPSIPNLMKLEGRPELDSGTSSISPMLPGACYIYALVSAFTNPSIVRLSLCDG
jgi:Mrp family chromosome partitioning ATPase